MYKIFKDFYDIKLIFIFPVLFKLVLGNCIIMHISNFIYLLTIKYFSDKIDLF